jgi:hypothetical protein
MVSINRLITGKFGVSKNNRITETQPFACLFLKPGGRGLRIESFACGLSRWLANFGVTRWNSESIPNITFCYFILDKPPKLELKVYTCNRLHVPVPEYGARKRTFILHTE